VPVVTGFTGKASCPFFFPARGAPRSTSVPSDNRISALPLARSGGAP
jgi:hypothetical protein